MEDLVVKVENPHVRYAFNIFLDNYKEPIAQFLNNVLKNEVGTSDAFVEKGEDGVFKIYQSAPDKGYVLGQLDGTVQVVEYVKLPTDSKYVVFNGDKLTLFVKTVEGKPDIKAGFFVSINDAVKEIDSDSVKTAIATVISAEKNAAVDAKKAQKKAMKLKRELSKKNG